MSDQGAGTVWAAGFIIGVILGIGLGLNYGKEVMKAERMKAKCEKSLPRDKMCVMQYIPKVD